MKNHGNYVASLSQLGRWLAEQAEEARRDDPARDARRRSCSSSDGRVVGVRTGDKGRGRDGEELPNFEPGSDIVARVTVLAEGTQGHLTGVAIDHFGLAGREPAGVGARRQGGLEGREAARARHPHDGLAAARQARSTASSAARSSTRWARSMVTLGMVVGLDYRDVELSVHDLLQELKTHSLVRAIARRRRARRVGREDDSRGRASVRCRSGSTRRGCCSAATARASSTCRRSRGSTTRSSRDGWRRRRPSTRCGAARRRDGRAGWSRTTSRCARASSGATCEEVRNMRQAFGRGFWVGGALAGMMTATKRHVPAGRRSGPSPTPRRSWSATSRAARYPEPDGKLTFDKLSSVFLSGNRTRDDQPNHIRVQRHVPRELGRAVGAHVPGAGVRGRAAPTATGRRVRADAVELRPVRRDHREGRPADAARGRLGARVPADVSAADGSAAPADRALVVGPLAMPGFLLVLIGVRQRRPLFLLCGAVLLGLAVKRIERPRVARPGEGGGARRIGLDRSPSRRRRRSLRPHRSRPPLVTRTHPTRPNRTSPNPPDPPPSPPLGVGQVGHPPPTADATRAFATKPSRAVPNV